VLVRGAPGVEPLEARGASKPEAVLERERRARDDEHLDVGQLVRRAARDAARQDDLLRDLGRERIRHPVRERS
jgi:hypothetical protein